MSYKKNQFEHLSWAEKKVVCGIDEVGRGPLLGPLVLGCVVLEPGTKQEILQDSKFISEKKRNTASEWIKKQSLSAKTVSIDPWLVDKVGINKATAIAVKKLVSWTEIQLGKKIDLILTDKMSLGFKTIGNRPIITAAKGESWSCSIAAASILAKVKRDALLNNLATIFPAFSLEKNKGYGTKSHMESLETIKLSIQHRRSYCKSFLKKQGQTNDPKPQQLTIL